MKRLYSILLSREEKTEVLYALSIRTNVIETGRAELSAESAKNTGQHNRIRNLTAEQQAYIKQLKELYQKILSTPSVTR